ncbi:hypothetical protein ACROYT_G019125 [Oculina patagonica]
MQSFKLFAGCTSGCHVSIIKVYDFKLISFQSPDLVGLLRENGREFSKTGDRSTNELKPLFPAKKMSTNKVMMAFTRVNEQEEDLKASKHGNGNREANPDCPVSKRGNGNREANPDCLVRCKNKCAIFSFLEGNGATFLEMSSKPSTDLNICSKRGNVNREANPDCPVRCLPGARCKNKCAILSFLEGKGATFLEMSSKPSTDLNICSKHGNVNREANPDCPVSKRGNGNREANPDCLVRYWSHGSKSLVTFNEVYSDDIKCLTFTTIRNTSYIISVNCIHDT